MSARALLPIALVGIVGALPATVQAAEPKDFTAISKLVNIDGGPKSYTFEERLYVKGNVIGRDHVRCEFGKPTTCLARFKLNGGTIVGKGPLRKRDGSQTLPIVDGSDRYAEARGVLIVDDLPKKKSRLTFNFR